MLFRSARSESYHQIILSMKSSNPQVMVQAYRLLIKTMFDEFGEIYPLHLGVTEAGDGEDGRIKSAVGIGTLLEDGIGDTIRVSLTEDPEFEIPVCRDLVKRYSAMSGNKALPALSKLPYSPFEYKRRESFAVHNIGKGNVPVVVADLSRIERITPDDLRSIGYTYNASTDKWTIGDAAADCVFTGHQALDFELPGTLKVILFPAAWEVVKEKQNYYPLFSGKGFTEAKEKHGSLNFVMLDCYNDDTTLNDHSFLDELANDPTVVLCLNSTNTNAMQSVRRKIGRAHV